MSPFIFSMSPFIFVIVIVAIVCGTVLTLVKTGLDHRARHRAGLSDEETRLMQEIHQSLAKMEKRVEALETIIINRK